MGILMSIRNELGQWKALIMHIPYPYYTDSLSGTTRAN